MANIKKEFFCFEKGFDLFNRYVGTCDICELECPWYMTLQMYLVDSIKDRTFDVSKPYLFKACPGCCYADIYCVNTFTGVGFHRLHKKYCELMELSAEKMMKQNRKILKLKE